MGLTRAFILCAILGIVCGADQSLTVVQASKLTENELCQDCRAFVQDFDDMFLGPSMEENVMQRMEKMCARLPNKVGKFCDEVFTDWIDNVFKVLDSVANPDVVCNALPFCGDDETELVQQQNMKDGDGEGPFCAMCEMVLGQLTSLVTDRRLQSDIEEFAQMLVCTSLPTPFNGMCKDELDSILELFFKMFDMELDVGNLCSVLGMCTAPGPARRAVLHHVVSHGKVLYNKVHKYSFLLEHLIDQDWTPVLHSAINAIHNKEPEEGKEHEVTSEDGPLCAMCEGLMGNLAALTTSAEFKADIEDFTEGITCQFLPTPMRGLCKDEIDRLTDIFFDLARTQLAGDHICKIVGLCGPAGQFWQMVNKGIATSGVSGGVSRLVRHVTKQNWSPVVSHFQVALKKEVPAIKVNAEESPQCTLCKQVLGQIESMVKNPEMKADVERLSEAILCAAIPGELGELCKTEVDKFADVIFDFVSLSMNATNVCQMTGLCWAPDALLENLSDLFVPATHMLDKAPGPVETLPEQETVTEDASDSPQCTLCKEVLGQFENVLTNPELKRDIEYLSNAVLCSLLPGQLRTMCKKEVDRFADMIFDLINLSMNASSICEMIGICWESNMVEHSLAHHLVPAMNTVSKVLESMTPLLKKIKENKDSAILEHAGTKEDSTNDAACNVCRRVMDMFKDLMTDDQFESDVEEMAIEFMCPILPKSFQGMCKLEINQIISTFFELLDSDVDVKIMCNFLGMCSDDNSHSTLKELVSSALPALDKMAEVALPILQRLEKIKSDHGDCAYCEIVMNGVFNFLHNDISRGKVMATAVKYCHMLPESVSTHCKDFVHQNVLHIMDAMVHSATPNSVCTQALMCDDEKEAEEADEEHEADSETPQPKGLLTILGAASEEETKAPMPKNEASPMKVTREHRAPWCDICEEVSATVNAFIGSQELLRVATSIGDSICILMPDGLKYPCDTFVRTFFDEFLGDVSSFMTPDFLCGVIGVCYIEFTPMNYTHSQYLHPSFHHRQ